MNCIIFINDPTLVAKLASLVTHIDPIINVHKFIDVKQIESAVCNKHILITDDDYFSQLKKNPEYVKSFEKLIILTERDDFNSTTNIHFIEKKYIITRLGTLIDDFIHEKFKKVEYLPYPIELVPHQIKLPCDLYLKLTQNKFLKIFNIDDEFTVQDKEKYKKKSINNIFINKLEYEIFKDFIRSERKVYKNKEVHNELNTIDTLFDYYNDLGFDDKSIEMTKKIHENIKDNYKNKFLKNLFLEFENNSQEYVVKHSLLTSIIAITLSKKFNWMNIENREKIYLGSVLHDMGYKDRDNAKYEHLKKSDVKQTDQATQADIFSHTTELATKLGQINTIHADVIKIVKDHHAVHGEESYPHTVYSSEVNLIFALFIVSHEFALELEKANFESTRIPILIETVANKFTTGNYRKIIPEFKESMTELLVEKTKLAS